MCFAYMYAPCSRNHSTLKVYRKGEAVDYKGPRKADGIISYMTKSVVRRSASMKSAYLD